MLTPLVALLLLSAGAARAAVVDDTFRCSTLPTGGVLDVGLRGWPQTWEKPWWFPADAIVFAGAMTPLVGIHSASPGENVDGDRCKPSHARVPLAVSGLPGAGKVRVGEYTTIYIRCVLAHDGVDVHVRVVHDRRGLPIAARVAVRAVGARRNLAVLAWSWTHVAAWASPRCEHRYAVQP